ncbi:hypothetical protein GCK32_004733, partial [Trichostrongylus colubriformis]
MPSDDRFADAVKPALEALLSDLQHTTEVLRRGHATSPLQNDIEPIYQEQHKRNTSRSQSHHADLDSVEKLVNSYSLERERSNRRSYDDVVDGGASSRSPIGNRPSVQSLFSQLELNDHDGISRKSLGPSQAHSYNDVVSNI